MKDPTAYDVNTAAVRDLDDEVPQRSHSSRARSRLQIWLVPLVLLALIGLAVVKLKPEVRDLALAVAETAQVSLPGLSKPTAAPAPRAAAAPSAIADEPAQADPAEPPDEPADEAELRDEPEAPTEALPETLESRIGQPGAGDYHLVVASLRSLERAQALAARLAKQGHSNAEHQAVGGPRHGWWHTVRMGPFKTRIEAEIARLALPSQSRLDAFVVPRAQGPYNVQVSSLRAVDKAEKLVERLRRQGHHARRFEVRRAGQEIWHAVRIGPFDTRAEADAYRRHFEQAAGLSAVVVPFERRAPSSR